MIDPDVTAADIIFFACCVAVFVLIAAFGL